MNREIFVPLLPWLIGGSRIGGIYNTYISSVGTDGSEGCFGKKIFNYRIWIEKIEEDEYLKLREELNLGPIIQEEPVVIKEDAEEIVDQPVVEEPKVITAADLQAKIDQLEALVKQLLSQN